MKELSIKQKAKAYDKALKEAVIAHKDEDRHLKATLEKIFPELKESKDEKIRKGLIKAVSRTFEGNTLFGTDVTREEALAWLEKQEHVRGIVERCKTSWYNEGKIQGQIEGLSDEEKYQQGWHDALEKQGEQNLANSYCQEHCKGFQETGKCFADGDCKAKTIAETVDKIKQKFEIGDSIKTANEEPLTITEITDSGYWSEDLFICSFEDSTKWELVEQKPAWSEEDEITKNALINLVEIYYGSYINKSEKNRLLSWLKSLKPQNTWKPSDEQLDALQYVYRNFNPLSSDKLGWNSLKTLELMYHDLKKLKGE